MSNPTIPPTPPSPGVGARRKGHKTLPRLPLTAFSPPNSGVSESFPLPPSPSTVHPDRVVDASVGSSLADWKREVSGALKGRIGGVVVKITQDQLAGLEAQASEADVTVLSAAIQFDLEDAQAPIISSAKYPISLSTSFTKHSEQAAANLNAALKAGSIVDIDVQASGDSGLDGLEDLLTRAIDGLEGRGTIILSNILPPPHDLELPIVKLLTHPTYQTYQAHIAALSLFPNLYVKFLPPAWNAPTPPTPPAGKELVANEKEKKEWKRRIKMYLGPAVEAFGFQRILFGSAPSPSSHAISNAGDWYEIARESFAELGVEQPDVDNVFGGNAQRVYSASS